MELREESEKIKSKNSKEYKDFCDKINEQKTKCMEKFRRNYENRSYEDASEQIKKMKFYISIENDFKKDIL